MRSLLCFAALALPLLAQQPRLEGFPTQSGGTSREMETTAEAAVSVIGTNLGQLGQTKVFLGEIECVVFAVTPTRINFSVPKDIKSAAYDLKVVTAGGESNKLRLRIGKERNVRPDGEDGGAESEALFFFNKDNPASVIVEGNRTVIRALGGSSSFPQDTQIAGELVFYDGVVHDGLFLFASDKTFKIEFVLEAGVRLRPGNYQIRAHFGLRNQRSTVRREILRLQPTLDPNTTLSLTTWVAFQEDQIAACEAADRAHYTELCEQLVKASNRLDAAFASASKVFGIKDGAFDENYWRKWVIAKTDCLPGGQTQEERDAKLNEWLRNLDYSERDTMRFKKDAWRTWIDQSFRSETEPGIRGLFARHHSYKQTYSYPAYPDADRAMQEAISLLMVKSQKYGLMLYQQAGLQAAPEDSAAKIAISGMEGQVSNTSRDTFDGLVQKVRRRLRITTP